MAQMGVRWRLESYGPIEEKEFSQPALHQSSANSDQKEPSEVIKLRQLVVGIPAENK